MYDSAAGWGAHFVATPSTDSAHTVTTTMEADNKKPVSSEKTQLRVGAIIVLIALFLLLFGGAIFKGVRI